VDIKLQIPDEIAQHLSSSGVDIPRRAIEALALEGFRDKSLTLFQVSELLGLSRIETEDFLGQHQVPLSHLQEADLDREAQIFEAAFRRLSRQKPS
jgi:predicted HTH domain antitoxin